MKTDKRKEHDAKYRTPSQPRFIADPSVGLCAPQPWRVIPSEGFFVLQIDTKPNFSFDLPSDMLKHDG